MTFRTIFLSALLTQACWCSTQTFQEVPLTDDGGKVINSANIQPYDASVKDRNQAHDLIVAALAAKGVSKADVEDPSFYCIIHIVRWQDSDTGKVDKQHWYVFRGGKPVKDSKPTAYNPAWSVDDLQGSRLYGTKGFWLLYVHLNASKPYLAEYDSAVTGKIQANLASLFAVAKLFNPAANTAAPAAPEDTNQTYNFYGGTYFEASVPSDIVLTAKKLPPPGAADTAAQSIADNQKFDNESKYFFDFSVGVPIKKVSELTFDSKANTVSPTPQSNRKALALVDIHFPPVDVKSTKSTLIPYLVSGVSIDSQPLHQILVGVGWGLPFANMYIGSLWVKQPGATAGAPASFSPQLAIGINLTVSAFSNLKK